MIRIQQLRLLPGHSEEELWKRAARTLKIRREQVVALTVYRRSIDARKKPDIRFCYVVDVKVEGIAEKQCVERCHDGNVFLAQQAVYRFPKPGTRPLENRPVVIGSGPAGLFCAWQLAMHGYCPLLLERGQDVEQRKKDVEAFWETGVLQTESNVAFGEGGAGTFSDGKLNTLVKDREGRGREVLSIFAQNGAQQEILYEAMPHIGTDVLTKVVKNMRLAIEKQGGSVWFGARVDALLLREGKVEGVRLADGRTVASRVVVLASGHSARDTYEWLEKAGISMEAKAFAVGLRVEHPQELINAAQYGAKHPANLPPAPYKVTARSQNGRGVYSFCMCPGGYVVNAGSEPGRLATNGMSYNKRDSGNANSAVIVSVTPQDYGQEGPLAGIAFQRRLEEAAFLAGKGEIPVQRYGSFCGTGACGFIPENFLPCIKGKWRFADVASLLPKELYLSFVEGMGQFGKIIPGFDDANALVSGVESRTSSPVRILRDESLQANVRGLYPCGEGAGYAGGITSAAMDGMRVAEAIAAQYAPYGQ